MCQLSNPASPFADCGGICQGPPKFSHLQNVVTDSDSQDSVRRHGDLNEKSFMGSGI